MNRLVESALPDDVVDFIDIAPVDSERESVWLVLARDDTLGRFDADTGEWTALISLPPIDEPDGEAWSGHVKRPHLHASKHGEFAAVVTDYGRFGQIIDLTSGQVSLALDGGEGHPETVPFSFAFAEIRGRTCAIHRTAWNRLDIADPRTGAVLTERGPTTYRGEPRPEHYLDYFHGALYVSPNGEWIADDGWVWHPVGVPTAWNLPRWLRENRWESEDGATKVDVCARGYYWDQAMAWLDSSRLVVGGIGDDADNIVDGARIFDVTSRGAPSSDEWRADLIWAREVRVFPGPRGRFFVEGSSLLSSDEHGLSVWDVQSGARTEVLEGFSPTHQHRGAGELVQIAGGTILRWRSG